MSMAPEQPYHVISERLRDSVWNQMYRIDLVSRYYQELLKKHKKIDLIFRLLTAISAVLTVVISLLDQNIFIKFIPVSAFLGLYLADAKVKFNKVNPLTRIRSGSAVVGSMLKDLWTEIETGALDDTAVKYRLSLISQTESALVSRHIIDSKFTENRELNIKCAEEAKQVMINFYKGASV